MNLLLPFSTCHRHEVDFNEADDLQESEKLIERQQVIQSVVLGDESASYLLDVLESQGLDPVEYVAMVEANVNYLISHPNLIVTPSDLLILH
jgi:hypothetical protein